LMYAFEPAGRPKLGERKPLNPIDDLPPTTVITHVSAEGKQILVRGTRSDNGTVKKVVVNGQAAKAVRPNFAEGEVTLKVQGTGTVKLTAHAEDAAGNVERRPHVVAVAPAS